MRRFQLLKKTKEELIEELVLVNRQQNILLKENKKRYEFRINQLNHTLSWYKFHFNRARELGYEK